MLQAPMPSPSTIILKVYGEDEILKRNHRKASSRPVPGRMAWNPEQDKLVWSILHERGNRKLISSDEIPANTWVRNAYNAWTMQFMDTDSLGSSTYADASLGLKTTAGGAQATTTPVDVGLAGVVGNGFRAGSGVATTGLVAGRGDGVGAANAYSFENFDLQDIIEEGTGSGGKFNYAAMDDYTVSKVTHSSLVWTNAIQRFMNNNSGETVVVEEVALFCTPSSPGAVFMFARDVLGGDFKSVADEGQFDLTYSIKSPTYPS